MHKKAGTYNWARRPNLSGCCQNCGGAQAVKMRWSPAQSEHEPMSISLFRDGTPPPLSFITCTPMEGPFFRPHFQTLPKPPQCHPLGPKVCPRPPKCLQNGGRREPWRVPKNVFVSTSVKKVPTSPKPHYLLCFVKVCPWPKPWIFVDFGSRK